MDPLQALEQVKATFKEFRDKIDWELDGPVYRGELVVGDQVEFALMIGALGGFRVGSATLMKAKAIVHLPPEFVDEVLPVAKAACAVPKTTVAECWRRFSVFCVPEGASENQRATMRNTFYAGFLDCFQAMQAISHAGKTDEETSAMLNELEREARANFEKMVDDPEMKGAMS